MTTQTNRVFRGQDFARFSKLQDCPHCAGTYRSAVPMELDSIEPCADHAEPRDTPPAARYELIEEGNCFSTVEAASAEAALDTIDPDWADYGGDPDDTTRTTRYTEITARNVDDEDDVETREYRMDPPAPPCADGHAHEWSDDHDLVGGLPENPGVWGHGGGVRIHTACIHCGCGKVVDTWAQGPTGEQGLQALEYHPAKYADQIAARQADTDDEE